MAITALLVATMFRVISPRVREAESLLVVSGFPTAYADVPAVKTALEASTVDDQAAKTLKDPAVPVDVKLAIACAYAARLSFTPFADGYATLAYGRPLDKIPLESLRGDELLVLGMMANGTAGASPDRAARFFEAARKKLPHSFTVALALAMARAQLLLSKNDGCAPYRLAVNVLRDGTLDVDIRQSGIDAVFDHVANFRETCPRRGIR